MGSLPTPCLRHRGIFLKQRQLVDRWAPRSVAMRHWYQIRFRLNCHARIIEQQSYVCRQELSFPKEGKAPTLSSSVALDCHLSTRRILLRRVRFRRSVGRPTRSPERPALQLQRLRQRCNGLSLTRLAMQLKHLQQRYLPPKRIRSRSRPCMSGCMQWLWM